MNIEKGTIELRQTLQRVGGTQGPFSGKLMGAVWSWGTDEEGGGARVWRGDNVSWGFGGGSPPMRNGFREAGLRGCGERFASKEDGGFRCGIGRISVTPRRRRSRDVK